MLTTPVQQQLLKLAVGLIRYWLQETAVLGAPLDRVWVDDDLANNRFIIEFWLAGEVVMERDFELRKTEMVDVLVDRFQKALAVAFADLLLRPEWEFRREAMRDGLTADMEWAA